MNLQSKRNTKVLILAVLIVSGVVWYFILSPKEEIVDVANPEKTTTQQIPVKMEEYVGLISSTIDGQNIYTNNKYGFKFAYPKGWLVGDNHLGYGTFQLFNYDVSQAGGKSIFQKGQNKIEVAIVQSNVNSASPDYPEKSRVVKQVSIAGQTATKFEIELIGGEKIYSYIISLPSITDKYLSINMYGDPFNFLILNQIVGSIVWLSR